MKTQWEKYLSVDFFQSVLLTTKNAVFSFNFWKELILITLGMLAGAASVYYFLIPSKLVVGSITGLSIVINKLIGGDVNTLSYLIFGINAFLLIMALILIGPEFGVKTAYAALILAPLIQFLDRVCPITNFTHRVIQNPEILAQLQAGQSVLDSHGNPYLLSRSGEVLEQFRDSVMSAGLGMGDVWFDLLGFVLLLSLCQTFEFRLNASTGGLDILAKIINKFLHFDIGASVTIAGVVICCTAFAINDFRLVVVGLIGTWINGLVVDYLMGALNKRKRVRIVSEQESQIRNYIISTLQRGCSLYELTGGYSHEKFTAIEAIITQDEYANLMKFVDENKIPAFITVDNCSEIHGSWRDKKK